MFAVAKTGIIQSGASFSFHPALPEARFGQDRTTERRGNIATKSEQKRSGNLKFNLLRLWTTLDIGR
jgi:hypothetical protein